jgi:hypothetical protein
LVLGGSSKALDLRLGMDWRPLAASLCLHFAIVVACGLLIGAARTSREPATSIANVSLASPKAVELFDNVEFAGSLGVESDANSENREKAIGIRDESAPLLISGFGISDSEFTLSGNHFGAAAVVGANSQFLTPRIAKNSTDRSEAGLGNGGNTEADERLMEDDIARALAMQPPSGPSTKVKLFGASFSGHSFVFVIDRSASTGSKHYAASAEIERQCLKAIDELPVENRFGIVLYNDRVAAGGGLKLATNTLKKAARERLILFVPSGGTMHNDAVLAALLMRPNVVCWFSDGGDPYLSTRQVEELTLLAARSKTKIHTWRLGKQPDDPKQDFMKVLADKTGGTFSEGVGEHTRSD